MSDLNYPTEEELAKIKEWDCKDFTGLMDFVHGIWEFADWGWRKEGKEYHISTGGWSGNEDIIGALKHNMMFWVMYWKQSRRGGHYIFGKFDIETAEDTPNAP